MAMTTPTEEVGVSLHLVEVAGVWTEPSSSPHGSWVSVRLGRIHGGAC